jgi:hypothetical protein
MKNNKGYYGWIHSLNQAGLQAQQNGARMINEAKAGRPSKFPADLSDFQYDPNVHQEIAAEKKAAGTELSDIKRSRTQLANQVNTVNLAPIGNANAERIQHDEVGEMLDTEDILDSDEAEEASDAAAIRASALANKARREAEEDTMKAAQEPEEDEYRYEVPSAAWKTFKESVSQKINRILRG